MKTIVLGSCIYVPLQNSHAIASWKLLLCTHHSTLGHLLRHQTCDASVQKPSGTPCCLGVNCGVLLAVMTLPGVASLCLSKVTLHYCQTGTQFSARMNFFPALVAFIPHYSYASIKQPDSLAFVFNAKSGPKLLGNSSFRILSEFCSTVL